jgi:peptidylprolyl isomerase
MDRRLIGLLVFAGALAIVVIAVLIGRGGDDSDVGSTVADAGAKPTVEVPQGPAPTELQIEDLEQGDGEEAKAGDNLGVFYVGVDYETGEEFDSNWGTGQPFSFQLGSGQVIPGWDQGVEGMKVGGRRQLIIPPDLAYGAQGQPPAIGPNATLLFVIELASIDEPNTVTTQ